MRKSIQAHMPMPFQRPAPTLAVSRSFALKIGTPLADAETARGEDDPARVVVNGRPPRRTEARRAASAAPPAAQLDPDPRLDGGADTRRAQAFEHGQRHFRRRDEDDQDDQCGAGRTQGPVDDEPADEHAELQHEEAAQRRSDHAGRRHERRLRAAHPIPPVREPEDRDESGDHPPELPGGEWLEHALGHAASRLEQAAAEDHVQHQGHRGHHHEVRAYELADEDAVLGVLVSEFVRTYFVVVTAMALVLYMVFSGRLLKPGGGVPEGVFQPFTTWQFWGVVAGFVAVRWFTYWWDWVRGAEAAFMPPAGVVAAPLRRLFVLQFGVLVGGPIVYWPLRPSGAARVVLVVLTAAADERRGQ